jgi:hypothetical protein
MYYDELLETVDDLSITNKMNKMKSTEMGRNADKNYDKFTILFNNTWRDGKFHKKVTIELYGSGQQGSKIRNAVTGERYSHLVGSAAEDLYFKVVDSTARNGRKDPLMLYYDTPEQYENHHFTTVETDVKERWYEKCLYARKRMTKV